MTTAVSAGDPSAQSGLNCRVQDRYEIEIEASCQPFVAHASSEMAWSGRICDISVGGLGLVLPRRFEPGAGLSIELPTIDENIPPEIFVAKVVSATMLPDRQWLLGCQFLSELSEEHLQSLVDMSLSQEQTAATAAGPPEPEPEQPSQHFDIIFVGPRFRGRRPKLRIRQFKSVGEWPLPVNRVMHMRIGDAEKKVGLRVRQTLLHRGQWIVRYKFIDSPSINELIQFGWRP